MTELLIAVCNRDAAQKILHVHPYLMISITDPPPWSDGNRVQFFDDDERLDVLHLSFGDFHAKHFAFEHQGRSLKDWAMTPSHGSLVREFLEIYAGKFRSLIIHCEAGVSRSPSMALAIAEHFGVPRRSIEPVDGNWDAQPLNPWVYETTKAALAKNSIRAR